MAVSRAFRLLTFFVAFLAAGVASASTPAIVVDVDSGRVLHGERATDPWFPASVTKLMTLYVALDMVRSGEARMDQLLTVTESAAALPPSKMAFKPGAQIRLDNALRIIMVKSANDVAAVIAESLGGSVDGFADRMNQTSARLGMRESRWANPHGLPDDRQQTSARDMAILGRALLREFPQNADLFQIGAIQFGRRIMRNHNGLIGRYPGADGMKTGFICASGFNVVASAKRNGRRLITVVMGSSSANERTLKAAELFDYGFENVSSLANAFRPTLEALPASSIVTAPNMRPVICERRGPIGEEDGGVTAEGSTATPTGLLAFAGAYAPPTNRTVLGPRPPVQPIRVFLGAAPPTDTELAEQAAEEEAEELARKQRKGGKAAKVAARKPAPPAKTLNAPDPIIAEGFGVKKENGRVSLELKPVPSAAERATAARAAKPAIAAKPAVVAKPEAPAKPAVAAKPEAAAKPVVAAKPEAAAKPAVAAKPETAAKPAVAATPTVAAKPVAASAAKPAAAKVEEKPAAKPAAKPLNISPPQKPAAAAAEAGGKGKT